MLVWGRVSDPAKLNPAGFSHRSPTHTEQFLRLGIFYYNVGQARRKEGSSTRVELPRYFDFGIGSRFCRIYCRDYFWNKRPDEPPPAFAQYHDSNLASGKVLLVAKVFVGGEQHLKPGFFGRSQQLAVGEPVPTQGFRFFDRMTRQRTGNSPGVPWSKRMSI